MECQGHNQTIDISLTCDPLFVHFIHCYCHLVLTSRVRTRPTSLSALTNSSGEILRFPSSSIIRNRRPSAIIPLGGIKKPEPDDHHQHHMIRAIHHYDTSASGTYVTPRALSLSLRLSRRARAVPLEDSNARDLQPEPDAFTAAANPSLLTLPAGLSAAC